MRLTPATGDAELATRWLGEHEGVIAKHAGLPYEPGKRAMVKVKPVRTADCVVAGLRLLADRPLPGSLLLGVYDDDGVLHHVGIASSFSERHRHELLDELRPLVAPLAGHPWEHGFLVGGGFPDAKALAREMAERLARERPDLVVATQRRSARRGKVLVDWLQNDPTRSTAAPYSLRATPRPRVAAPLTWDELATGGALVVSPHEIHERLRRHGDLWRDLAAQ